MPGTQAADPSTDAAFLAAGPNDQRAYLAHLDPDYAKASPQDQEAYRKHVTGTATNPKMETSKIPGLVRGATSALPLAGAAAAGAMTSPGIATTAAGIGLGTALGESARLAINHAAFGNDDPANYSAEGLKNTAEQGAIGAGTTAVLEGAYPAISKVSDLASDAKGAVGRFARYPGRTSATGIETGQEAGQLKPWLKLPFVKNIAEPFIPAHPEPITAEQMAQESVAREQLRASARPPKPAEPPLPGIPGATQSDAVGQTATPGSLNAITPAPGDMTSTGGAPVQFSGPAVAPPKTPKIPGQVMRVPEPTGGDPRWMASVPRGKLPGLAAQGREGAAEQLQNIGKTVLIEPRGGDISNVRERTTFGTEGQVAETKAIPASERTQTPGATKRNAFGEIIKEDAPGKSAPTFKTVAPEAPKQLTEEESRDTRAQIADLRRQARGFAAKQETARVWTKANEYMRREKALLDKADLLEKNLGLGKTARPALTGSTKEELHATYNSASPEIKTEVDRLAEEYKTLESFEKSHFEHDYGLDRSTGGWTGLPIKERLARVLSRAPAANPDDEPPF